MDDDDGLNHLFEDRPTSPSPQRRKRSFQMLRPGAHIDNYYSASPQYPTSSSASLNRFFPPPPPPPPANRYPGDGLDFRRPAMSTSMPSNDVIDLTGSDSPPSRPQSGRISPGQRTQRPGLEQEVITLEDSEDEGGGRPRRRRRHEEAPSMDVEFLRSRTLRPPTPPDYAPRGLAWHAERARERVDRQPSWANGFFDLGDHLPNLNPFAHSRLLTGFARGTRRPRPNLPTIQAARRSETLLRPHAVHFAGNFTPPELNYHGAAFTVGRPEPVQYEAPEAPEPGFTRTPNKDDVLVCPNCDRELGTGDTDLGKQIWVIRSCGHVYCGDCATGRHRSKKKRDGSTKTFTHCVVDTCGEKSVSSSKAMFQVYI